MADTIYYSKVQFDTKLGGATTIERVLLNVPQRELSYQSFDRHGDVEHNTAIKLSEKEMESLLPYLDTSKFEPYRGKKQGFDDEGRIGYRDEVSMSFTGITDSHIPMLELKMYYYYDEEHTWPNERLYRVLCEVFSKHAKGKKKHIPLYGTYSLWV